MRKVRTPKVQDCLGKPSAREREESATEKQTTKLILYRCNGEVKAHRRFCEKAGHGKPRSDASLSLQEESYFSLILIRLQEKNALDR